MSKKSIGILAGVGLIATVATVVATKVRHNKKVEDMEETANDGGNPFSKYAKPFRDMKPFSNMENPFKSGDTTECDFGELDNFDFGDQEETDELDDFDFEGLADQEDQEETDELDDFDLEGLAEIDELDDFDFEGLADPEDQEETDDTDWLDDVDQFDLEDPEDELDLEDLDGEFEYEQTIDEIENNEFPNEFSGETLYRKGPCTIEEVEDIF